ncbi:PAS domain S-box protein [Bacillus sp. CGMCC 1.16607]|uniref:PAS domain S-box protein n=1 Tax=Bacillus sp. CGMCC 1.16607 TaxID=3351842 RepID=UPI00363C0C69
MTVLSSNPVMLLISIILTVMSTYTALDLFTLIGNSKKNKRFLFLGGTFTFGIGIWVMNFIGLLAIDIDRSAHFDVLLTILSIVIGISITGFAFIFLIGSNARYTQLILGSIFLTISVFSVHLIGMNSMDLLIKYDWLVLSLSLALIFVSFLFSLWMLFFSKSLSNSSLVWLKPISALIMTGAIVEGHFLLMRASTIIEKKNFEASNSPDLFILYLILLVSVVILTGLIGTSALISKRLAKSDLNLKDITAALDASSIVAITDEKGIITFVNHKFVEISGFEENELLGKNHNILNSGFHSPAFFKNLWKTIGQGEIWKGEIRNRAKDGSYYWVDTTIVPFLNRKGKPYQYVSIRSDITDRKLAEEKVTQTLKDIKDFKFALDQSSIVAITNSKGIITYVNDKFCEISKYSEEELIGEDHRILNSGVHSKEFFKNFWRKIGQGEVWKGEICNRAKDGTLYWVDTTIVPFLNDQGKPYQYLAIRNDITERKRTEEIIHRQDKLAAVGQLAAGVAHEIRNPLTSMKGYTEFLTLDETDPQRKEFLDIILDEIERVNNIVEEFMVLAKPKIIELEEKNIIPVIKNVVSLLEFEARKKNVRLQLECQEEIIQVECDENRLKQVFLNFIKNGIEAMPNGGDLIVRTSINKNNVQISIRDTGIGISEEKLKKLGEPFYTTKKNGNGLGLMVSFKIIESHNGKVYVESELNKGTTFNIVLPAKIA